MSLRHWHGFAMCSRPLSRFHHSVGHILDLSWRRIDSGAGGITMARLRATMSVLGGALRPRYTLPTVTLLVVLYFAALHPWLMTWGATPEEQQIGLPGDE